jgi:hypothetical protein
MSVFLTSLPDLVEGDEQRAVKHLRTVVKLLEKENHSFSKDCADKVAYQNKQQILIREDNERLRIKVNELSRPKVSVLAAIEETQSNLHNTVDGYTAKIDVDERELELLEVAMHDVASKIDEYQQRMRGKVKPVDMTIEQLHDLGFNPVKEGSRTVFEGPQGERYRSKNDVCKSLSYVADSKIKKKLEMLENRVQQVPTLPCIPPRALSPEPRLDSPTLNPKPLALPETLNPTALLPSST